MLASLFLLAVSRSLACRANVSRGLYLRKCYVIDRSTKIGDDTAQHSKYMIRSTDALTLRHYSHSSITMMTIRVMMIVVIVLSTSIVVDSRRAIGQNVILLLIDGFGNSLLNDTRSSTSALYGLKAMADNGVQAEYLKPSFPTLSYPNWYSLVTGESFCFIKTNRILFLGLYVENHGFTGNFMYDSETEMRFMIGRGENDTNQVWSIIVYEHTDCVFVALVENGRTNLDDSRPIGQC